MGDASRPPSAKHRLVVAMSRLDRLLAELDDAVERLDEHPLAPTEPADPVQPAPAPERARARWYWTMPATTVPPAPSDVVDLTEVPTPP
jgi:hypothetical protein